LEGLSAQQTKEEVFEGGIVLVARLFGLLVAFIGENLTLQFVREVWPEVPLEDLDFGNGGKDEPTE